MLLILLLSINKMHNFCLSAIDFILGFGAFISLAMGFFKDLGFFSVFNPPLDSPPIYTYDAYMTGSDAV